MNKKLLWKKSEEIRKENENLKAKNEHLHIICKQLGIQVGKYEEFVSSLLKSESHKMGKWCELCKHRKIDGIPDKVKYGMFGWEIIPSSCEIFVYCDKHLPEICKEFECEEVTE